MFGDRTLDENTTIRLFRLKQRTLMCLMWRFEIFLLPGLSNQADDAALRNPVSRKWFATVSP